ncbi:MAG: outer membrane lipoprotein-sorting protein [Candidatus Gygaella obscura]|nr:outer membrane lipoprotein-sorting protein [Candidatus Gygaella obscura]
MRSLLMKSLLLVCCVFVFVVNGFAMEFKQHEVYKITDGMNAEEIIGVSTFNKYTKFAYDYESTGYVHLIEKSGAKRQRTFLRRRIILGDKLAKIDYKDVTSFTAPTSVKGLGILSWTYMTYGQDSDQWLWIPSLKKIRKVSAAQGDDSFMGSDFTTEEVTTRKVEDETYKLLRQEKFTGYTSSFNGKIYYKDADCFVIEATPVRDPWYYSKRIVWVEKTTGGDIYEEIYDANGRKYKYILKEYQIKDVNGRDYSVQTHLEVEDLRSNHKTVIEIKGIKFDQGLKESDFSERILQRSKW